MSHQTGIAMLIEQLKNDKSVNPKWRNRIVSRLEEVEAMMHKLNSHEMSKAETEILNSTAPQVRPICMCPAGVRVVDCPVQH